MVPWIAYHEAGHAVATVLAFRHALWLPMPPPPLPVRYVEIVQRDGQWSGTTAAREIYSMKWHPSDVIKPRYRPLMEAQIVIELAGGVAEARVPMQSDADPAASSRARRRQRSTPSSGASPF